MGKIFDPLKSGCVRARCACTVWMATPYSIGHAKCKNCQLVFKAVTEQDVHDYALAGFYFPEYMDESQRPDTSNSRESENDNEPSRESPGLPDRDNRDQSGLW